MKTIISVLLLLRERLENSRFKQAFCLARKVNDGQTFENFESPSFVSGSCESAGVSTTNCLEVLENQSGSFIQKHREEYRPKEENKIII